MNSFLFCVKFRQMLNKYGHGWKKIKKIIVCQTCRGDQKVKVKLKLEIEMNDNWKIGEEFKNSTDEE